MAETTCDDDGLEYGYVLARPPEGGWWHMHFGRYGTSHHCELLGRSTDIVACLRWYAAGAVAKSPHFILTLDGVGVEVTVGALPVDFTWCYGAENSEAEHFQQSVVPQLRESRAFQSAAWEIVRFQRYLSVVTLQ